MIRISLSIFLLLAITETPFAQKNNSKYLQEAEQIRKDVWGWNKPEFAVRQIPSAFASSSKIIIGRHLEVSADSRKRLGVMFGGIGGYRELMLSETLRESVKLNDKKSVDEYSEIAYTQLEKKSGMLMDKTTTVYLGVRVIKPNGTVKEIRPDDIVLTSDEKKKKEAKIAVPDLQVGDIIDYFISKQTNMSQLNMLPKYTFTFFDEAPIMHCSMHVEIGKRYAAEYRCYNGAPEFDVKQSDDDGNILDVAKSNIPAFASSGLWTAPYRQLPVSRLNIVLGYSGIYAGRLNSRKPGTVYKNQPSEKFVEDKLLELSQKRYNTIFKFDLGDVTQPYLKRVRRSHIPEDSLDKELFYIFRFNTFLEQKGLEDPENLVSLPKADLNENAATFLMGEFFKSHDVDNSMVYYAPNGGPKMTEILSGDDLDNVILTEAGNKFYGLSSIFDCPGEVSAKTENNKAVMVSGGNVRAVSTKRMDRKATDIPASMASQNMRIENLAVSLNLAGGKINVQRRTTLTGHYKSEEQQNLILFEDYYNSERKYFNDDRTLTDRLNERRKTRAMAGEVEAVFAKARSENKSAFESEASGWFGSEVKNIKNFKVENQGVRHTSPDFVYSAGFELEDLIKKAGNNYIFEIGKLEGSALKLEGDARKRSMDIYEPFARAIEYRIAIAVPDGFTAVGVNELNRQVDNSTGSFVCEASLNNNTIILHLKKVYKNTFEPVGNWSKMLAFIDAGSEWNDAKVLLKKK